MNPTTGTIYVENFDSNNVSVISSVTEREVRAAGWSLFPCTNKHYKYIKLDNSVLASVGQPKVIVAGMYCEQFYITNDLYGNINVYLDPVMIAWITNAGIREGYRVESTRQSVDKLWFFPDPIQNIIMSIKSTYLAYFKRHKRGPYGESIWRYRTTVWMVSGPGCAKDVSSSSFLESYEENFEFHMDLPL